MKFLVRSIRMLFAFLFFVLVWHWIAVSFFDPHILPSPHTVLNRLFEIFEIGGPRGHSAWFHLWRTLIRVTMVVAIVMVLSIVLGLLMGLYGDVEESMRNILPLWMTFPTVVVVLVTMIMFNFTLTSIISAAVFAATPYATINIWEGTKNIDNRIIQMALSFQAEKSLIWRYVYIPGLMPAIFGTLRYIFGMVWKVVVLAEVFGFDTGMGAMFRFWFSQADIITLLAYLTLFLAVMFVLEYGFLYPAEKYVFRWQR